MSGSDPALPAGAYGAALAGLPAMGPVRLRAVLDAWEPAEAWRRVAAGRALDAPGVAVASRPDSSTVAGVWRLAALATDVAACWWRYQRAGVAVHVLGQPGYPAALAGDHEAPAVVFGRGRLEAVEGPRVAIVGSRRCTHYGRDVARELGRDLATQGVRVVSGLALGIDGAAHEGALAAACGPPVAVVGSGLDVPYPRRHIRLWAEVTAAGAMLSEAPLGAAPEPWRFPLRNRILAALAEVVVVVESHQPGGSRHTVEAAEARGRTVMAVPGPVRSSASAYTNELLATGCPPARDALDVLVALGLSRAGTGPAPSSPGRYRPPPDELGQAVLEALGWEAAALDRLVSRTGRSPAEVTLALAHLERDGWVAAGGGWWERVGP